MTRRATARGAQRTPLDGTRVDVLVCGASFAGLAVARELAGCGASVLIVDRYAIGERATSACAVPSPWLAAVGGQQAARQELAHMRFSTPHGSFRYRLPWSWTAFDYRHLCQLLFAQSDARFETATVTGRAGGGADGELIGVQTDRGVLWAPLVVDALGWRRVLAGAAGERFQPPRAPLSRGLEVHPEGDGEDLDVWIERSLVRRGYGWRVPAGGEVRVGVGSYEPRDHVRVPTGALARRLGVEEVRHQGNWFPHRLRPAARDGVFFAGDSAGHCFALSGEGIRPALYFGIACGRELRAVLDGRRGREEALRRYARFSASHRHAFGLALRLQDLLPRLPPRLLTALLGVMGRQPVIDRAFGWYLQQTPTELAAPPGPAAADASSGRAARTAATDASSDRAAADAGAGAGARPRLAAARDAGAAAPVALRV